MKVRFIIRFIVLITAVAVTWGNCFAQNNSNNGSFNVNEIKGCVPLSVTITSNEVSCPCDASCPCDVFPDGINNPSNFSQNNLNISYTTTGIYQLVVQLQNFEKDTIQIEVLENTAPLFQLTTCTANQVNVEIQDTNFDTYEINYNDGTIITVNKGQFIPPYTYMTSGTKAINVRGINLNAADNCIINNSQNVEILPSLQDASINNLALLSTIEAQLNYSAQLNTTYHLQLAINNNSNFQRYLNENIDPSLNTYTINDSNLDFEQNYYCFRIATFDKCSNTYTGFSNSICSVDLNPITTGNKSFTLDWTSYNVNVNRFVITKNSNNNYVSVSSNSYTDSNQVECNIEYCYSIVADYSTNGSVTSTSLKKCVIAVSTDIPTALVDISATVNTPNIDIIWELPTSFTPAEYQIFKNNEITPIIQASNSYTDLNTDRSCYQIDYTDNCLNSSSISREICSIYLESQIISGTVSLNWNNYNGWELGVSEYLVIVESTSGNNTYSAGVSTNFQLPDESVITQLIKVYIQAVPVNKNLPSVNSNVIEIVNSTNIQFPNAFVPGGINSTFNVKGRYIQSVDLKIFTRWGELVAHITDKENGWDGNVDGKNAPEGTYVYTADIIDESSKQHVRTGAVLLIRK
ncbi:MAG: gliding motility-associated C-terminal domain-containing protein [Cyclobacteriaceae bacterium]|nr:gliding motility-associated C-terminal domain-containing protein [Cyclobacteriaceae bacterium]